MVNTDKAVQRKKEGHGVFLTIVLLFQLLLAIWYLFVFIFGGNPFGVFIAVFQYTWPKNLLPIFETIFELCILYTLPFLWKLNKVGVYGLMLAAIAFVGSTYYEIFDFIRILFNFTNNQITDSIRFAAFLWCVTPLFIGCMYFWAIKRKWHLFS